MVADLGCGTGILGLGASGLGASFVVGVDIDPEALECARATAEENGMEGGLDFILCDVSAFGLSQCPISSSLSGGGGGDGAMEKGGVGCGSGNAGPFVLQARTPLPSPPCVAREGPVLLGVEEEEEEGIKTTHHPSSLSHSSAVRSSLEAWEGKFDTVIMNPPFGTRVPGVDVLFLRAALSLVHGDGHVFSLHKTSTRGHLIKTAGAWGVKAEAVAQLRFSVPATYAFHRQAEKDVEVDLMHFYRVGGRKPKPKTLKK